MSFEDPSKVKIDLVVGEDDADLTEVVGVDQSATDSKSRSESESNSESKPKSESDSMSESKPKSESESQPESESKSQSSGQGLEHSLQPWKNRFARSSKGESTPQNPAQQLRSLPFLLLDYGTFGFAIFNIVAISCALFFSPGEPVFMTGFLLFPIFAVRIVVMVNSVKAKGRFVSLGRAILPIIISNTMTTWGILLALSAQVVALVFHQVRGLEAALGPSREKIAMAVFAFCAAGSMQIFLIAMLLVSMLIFQRLFTWISRRTLEISAVDFGHKKAGSIGLIAGAIFGLCGLYTALGMGGENSTQTMNISTLIWSLGILVSSLFFTTISRIKKK
ncbi:MAG: hypothetical protein JST44_09500 [Cyanobacteria bacterium SZAS LIN-5]|nr:hypothetical protein [Cyanobacteria bacterium SZAS LIN-5]